MAIAQKPDYSTGIWAQGGNVASPTTDKINIGHVVERPPYETSNFVENRQDTGIVYIFQHGIPRWDANTTIAELGLSDHNGVTYRAKVETIGVEPSADSPQWTIAYADYTMFVDLQKIINKIETEDNYLTHLVYKNEPELVGRANGNGYLAESGITLTGDENVGYSFKNSKNSGLFYDNGKLNIALNSEVVGTFNTIPKDPKDFVTKEYLESQMKFYDVGDIYITTLDKDPNITKPYGKWVAFGEGRTLVGVSKDFQNDSIPNWVKAPQQEYGEYGVKLTAEQNGNHTHSAWLWDAVTSGEGNAISAAGGRNGKPWFVNTEDIQPSGLGEAHNNVQPSITAFFWLRVS